jgi:copper(I)-binding protein
MKFRQCVTFAMGLAFASTAGAQVVVDEAWVRATAPGQPVAAAYLKITSAQPAALVAVRTPLTARAEIHQMKMEGGIMKMRPVTRLELPAGKTVELKPGGYHLMLMNITEPLRPGESVPITLVVERPDGKRLEVEVKAEVRNMTTGMGSHGKMH